MTIEAVIVGIIILVAFGYCLKVAFLKFTSFRSKSSCGGDCGCDSGSQGLTKIEKLEN